MPPQTPPSSPFRSDCLQGKVAVVTGGGSGICFEITRQLLKHGCAGAVICGRREVFLARAADSLSTETGARCLYKTCDVRDADACAAVVAYALEQFGKIDILVNGAAGNFLAEAKALRPNGFRTVLEIDAMGTFNMSHAAYPALNANDDGGTIINISATLQYGATWFQVHASAAKSAVDSMTRTLALEWGSDNIRVNGIAPGPIEGTPGMTKLSPGLDGEDMNEMVSEGIPLGRMGTGFDIGMAAIFLTTDAGSYVTGDVLVVDGGHWLYKPPMLRREMVAEMSRKVERKSRDIAPTITSKL